MLRLATLAVSWVTTQALPRENRVSNTGPSAGWANHRDAESAKRISAVATKATPKTIHFRRGFPPSTARQVRPDSNESTRSVGMAITGSASQLLKAIATYCLSRTATQNNGSEKKRKAAKVIV